MPASINYGLVFQVEGEARSEDRAAAWRRGKKENGEITKDCAEKGMLFGGGGGGK